MRTSDFDYVLPPECIAARPAATRDSARLMVLDRDTGVRKNTTFSAVPGLLPARSLVVVNDTLVVPARLRGRKPTGGALEILLTRRVSNGATPDSGIVETTVEIWEALAKGMSGGTSPRQLSFGQPAGPRLDVEILERRTKGRLLVRVSAHGAPDVLSALNAVGEVPLPPYIETARRQATEVSESIDDRLRYQTVYAVSPGAVAAPTAGLHFTPEVLEALAAAGHEVVSLTLHVGPGTFRPVETEDLQAHEMDEEAFNIPPATAAAVNEARRTGRPVVAIGTTVVRALESAARQGGDSGEILAGAGESRLFLCPGDPFLAVTDLVTNFHLPRSTLLMLVSAFAGREHVIAAYQDAINSGYRFYSYGDAMLITNARQAP